MNNDIRKLVDDNWDEIKELIAQKAEAEQKPKNIWDLKTEDGEEYYSIESDGKIIQYMFNEAFDEDTRDIGNAFLTREEAEFEKERRKIEAILRKYSRPFVDGKPDYVLIYDRHNKTIGIDHYWNIDCGVPCFKTKEIAQQVINEIGEDRLKKYWFGVTE